jgi:glycosyltransferase involved in cell wall biosynthesis
MKVAMYHPWIYLRGGIERTILEIVSRSEHDWTLYTSHYRPEDTFPEFADFKVVELSKSSVKRDVWTVARACLRLLVSDPGFKDSHDALMISCDGIGNLMTLRTSGLPLLCLCHTPLKVAYDAHHHRRWLETHHPGIATRLGVQLFARVDRLAWRRYERIFCTSREVERRLLNAKLARPEQIEIAHPGVDTDRLRLSGRREPFFLWLGRIKWWKNPELALDSFLEYQQRGGSARLVVAGAVDDGSRDYFRGLLRAYGDNPAVQFVSPESDEELHDLLDRSLAVLCTTPNEDWGIVPLEAMAFGKPVIAVGRGGTAETIIDGETGYLCDESPAAFSNAMGLIEAADEKRYTAMSAAARARSEVFHWDNFVRQIDAYLDTLAPQPELQPLAV